MLIDIKVPVLAESVAEATLLTWQKHVGDQVKRGDTLIDIETDKVTLEVSAMNNGIITEIIRDDGEIVQSDEVIAKIETEADSATMAEQPAQQSLPEMGPTHRMTAADASPKLSPAVRNMLEEHELNAADISHDNDRITKEDVIKHLGQSTQTAVSSKSADSEVTENNAPPPVTKAETATEPVTASPTVQEIPALISSTGDRPEEIVPMTQLRKHAAKRLLGAQKENAILTTFNEINLEPVMDIRTRYKDEFQKIHDVKLGFMSFFTCAAIEALKKFPVINASVDGDNIVYHGYFDIGIAVSSPRGLVVPIIHDADLLSLAEIETRIRDYGVKAKDGKLTMDDLTGGTFTITNGGVFGSLLSTPIINPPQSAILGMHSIQQRPVAENNELVIKPMMYIALSYDHRIIDGREAVQFLVMLKKLLEDPARLLLQI